MFRTAMIPTLMVAALILVPVFANLVKFVKFLKQPDFQKSNIPNSIILNRTEVTSEFRCLELCKNTDGSLTVLIRDSRICFMLKTYCSNEPELLAGNLFSNLSTIPKLKHYRVPVVCEYGWYPGGAWCYATVWASTLDESIASCQNRAATIVTTEHAEENAILKQWLLNMTNTVDEYILGIRGCQQHGVLTYANGVNNDTEVAPFQDLHKGFVGKLTEQLCCAVMNKKYEFSWTLAPCDPSHSHHSGSRQTICKKRSNRKG